MESKRQKTHRRVGIVGFGRLGKFLYEEVDKLPDYEVAFIWNRTDRMSGIVPNHLILRDLNDFSTWSPDLIVEVAHPSISGEYGARFLTSSDFMIGSPTALADDSAYKSILEAAKASNYGLYVPVGAFWGGQDIQKMADRGTLKGLKVTMKKHPSAFKLCGELAEKVKTVTDTPVTLYEGPVRDLCPLAPNNVNTMACASIAAHNLGFDGVTGCLVADPSLNSHIVEIDVTGPGGDGCDFSVKTVRCNPASSGVVTGKQTYASFLSSMLAAKDRGSGVHVC